MKPIIKFLKEILAENHIIVDSFSSELFPDDSLPSISLANKLIDKPIVEDSLKRDDTNDLRVVGLDLHCLNYLISYQDDKAIRELAIVISPLTKKDGVFDFPFTFKITEDDLTAETEEETLNILNFALVTLKVAIELYSKEGIYTNNFKVLY
jgi:hypothetical protein